MISEDSKKHFLSSRDYFTAKRWEGKPLSYKFRFALANYPEILFSSILFLFVFPPILLYKNYTFEGSKKDAINKYKQNYVVVREDHPQIQKIIEEKEKGRHFFP